MYGKFLRGHILVVYSWIAAPFVLLFLVFEGLHFDIYFVCMQLKLLRKDGQGKHEYIHL